MTRNIEDTRKLFDTWAQTYDQDLKNANGILEGYDTSLLIAAQVCSISAGVKLLDIGIGTGNFARQFETKGAIVSGIDLSEAMLEKCRELHPSYELRTGTFQTIPFSDNAFDVVVSSFCFHEVPVSERRAACKELYRVTQEGGSLCLLDIMFASPAAMEEARNKILSYWDDREEYSLVGNLSEDLYAAGFHSLQWLQTTQFHWMCLAHK